MSRFQAAVDEHAGELPCQDPRVNAEDWFAPFGSQQASDAARRCAGCPIFNQCRDYAIDIGVPNGVWGGMHERDRELIWAERGGRPATFNEDMDAMLGPALQERRDFENFDAQNPGDVYAGPGRPREDAA